MQETMAADRGIVYVGYSDAVAWVSALPDDALEDFIVRMGEKPRREIGLQRHAMGIVFDEYKEQTYSNRIVRIADETLFDRDRRSLRIMDTVLQQMEKATSGYAFVENHDDCVNCVWTAGALVTGCHEARGAEDLHAYLRAMETRNDFYFSNDADELVRATLEDMLDAEGVEDRTELVLRYVGHRKGFLTEKAYIELVGDEGPSRRAISDAKIDHWRRFRDACGQFDMDRARKCFDEFGHARYYDIVRSSPEDAATAAANRAIHDAHAIKRADGERFRRSEREKGFSVYGYWFAPDGAVHAMNGFQIHDTWIRGTAEGGPGIPGGRKEALALGWVSMTMMDDKSTGANIAYGHDAPCDKALKAAAKIVRRGGSFENVVIEAYDGWDPATYEFHEDTRTGTRRLNEIATARAASSMRP
jgi:hypothetical protein